MSQTTFLQSTEPTTREFGENELFERWLVAPEEEKPLLEEELQQRLFLHARKLVWTLVRHPAPEIENYCVYEVLRQAKLGKFRAASKFTTWFESIVRRRCNTYLSKKILQRETEAELSEDMATMPNFDARLVLDEIRGLLNEEERRLLELQLDHSDNEIATKLGITPLAVRLRWMRIREKIKAAQQNR